MLYKNNSDSGKVLHLLKSTVLILLVLMFFSGCSKEPQKPVEPVSTKTENVKTKDEFNLDDIKINPVKDDKKESKFRPGYLSKIDKEKIASLDKKIDENPDKSELYIEKGNLYLGKFFIEKAEENLKKARELSPENPDVLLLEANILLTKGKKVKAFETCKKLIKKDKDNPRVYRMTAEVLISDLKFKQAEKFINKAIELDPENSNLYLLRSHLFIMMGKVPKILENLDEAVKYAGNDPKPYIARAMFQADIKEFDKALSDMDKALELDPDLVMVYLAKAKILQAQKKNKEALEIYRYVVEHFRDMDQRKLKLIRYKIKIMESKLEEKK